MPDDPFKPDKLKVDQVKKESAHLERLSKAEWTGIAVFILCLAVAPFGLQWSALLLSAFILLCFTAPFFPTVGFFLPVISRGPADKQAVALTFDDGPHPLSTPIILDLLAQHAVPATFFVTGRQVKNHPQLIRQIVSQGHTLGNHSYSHDNLIMLKSAVRLKEEIEKTQRILRSLGIYPLAFRPPVGITNPKLKTVLEQLGLYAVNFSRRSGDMGNRRVNYLSKKILYRLRSGDIILLHDTPPRNKALFDHWVNEVDKLLRGISEKNLKIVPLGFLIDRPVMAATDRQHTLNGPADERYGK